jgi:hypothetical protein
MCVREREHARYIGEERHLSKHKKTLRDPPCCFGVCMHIHGVRTHTRIRARANTHTHTYRSNLAGSRLADVDFLAEQLVRVGVKPRLCQHPYLLGLGFRVSGVGFRV